MKKFLLILFTSLLSLSSLTRGEDLSMMLEGDPQIGTLSGEDAGDELSFGVSFDTSVITDNHIIDSVKLVYYQHSAGSGLVHIIDRYSGDLIEVRNLNEKGFHFSIPYTDLFKTWITSPEKNYGLLFKQVAFDPLEKIDFSSIYLSIDYHLPDNLAPFVLSNEARRNKDYTNYIVQLETNEITTAEIEYGKTSVYTLKRYSDIADTLHSFDLVDLEIGLSYHYRFKLTDLAGNITYTKDSVFITGADLLLKQGYSVLGESSILPPTNITIEKASMNNRNGLLINFTASSNADLYVIYRKSSSLFEEISQTNTTSYFDTGLDNGVTYTYMIKALAGSDVSAESDHVVYTYEGKVASESIMESDARAQTFTALFTIALIIVSASYVIMHFGKRTLAFLFPRKEAKLKNRLRDPNTYY